MLLVVGVITYGFVRSRVHLLPTGVVVVNVITWREIPYGLLHKVEAGPGRGLALYVKGLPEEDSEIHSIGFAGSLVDRRFRTAEKAAKQINKAKKRWRGATDSNAVVRRGIVRDPVVESFVVMALGFAIASLFVR
ncbi:hypothetical protein [Streptomyces sp. bgisy034]|uniref:hypothetical protein n=1 Tax=Streptomyces sp. bgisy034 TaxID=3413774 RepID=UPI003EBDB25F